MSFNGLGMNMGNLSRLSNAQTRSISMENITGEKGKGGMATEGTGAPCARDLGKGWKGSPSIMIKPYDYITARFRVGRITAPGDDPLWVAEASRDDKAARRIVQTARKRHDGVRRNPFNEYECGSWYARAMSSYALLQAYSGARYDAIDKTLHLTPATKDDFRCFLATPTGCGIVGIRNGQPFFDVRHGNLEINAMKINH